MSMYCSRDDCGNSLSDGIFDTPEGAVCWVCKDQLPEEGDLVLYDTGPLLSRTTVCIYGELEGRHIAEYDSDEEALADVPSYTETEGYYPTIWRMSDHGNFHQISD